MIDKIKKKWNEVFSKKESLDVEKPNEVNVKFESAKIESFVEFSNRVDKQGYYDGSKLQSLFKDYIQYEIDQSNIGSYKSTSNSYPIWGKPTIAAAKTSSYTGGFIGFNDYYNSKHSPINIYKKHKNYLTTVNKFVDRWTEDPIETKKRLEYDSRWKQYKETIGGSEGIFLKDPYENNPFRTTYVNGKASGFTFTEPYNSSLSLGGVTYSQGIDSYSDYILPSNIRSYDVTSKVVNSLKDEFSNPKLSIERRKYI